MHLEIVSPEATLYSGEVSSVTLPGVDGEFQLLDNHAPIVSLLEQGNVKIQGVNIAAKSLSSKFIKGKDSSEFILKIDSGTIEMKDNRVIILAD